MRSRLICSLVSAGVFASTVASADVVRVRISVDELPRQDEPVKVAPKNAVLPNGARDGGAIPKNWRVNKDGDDQMESGRCTDGRLGSVGTIYSSFTSTMRIWEADGKTWLDSVDVDTTFLVIQVKRAERVPLKPVTDGVWAYRRKNEIVVVSARDIGFIEHGSMYECRISETSIDVQAGTAIIDSSPKDVNDVKSQIAKWNAEPGKPIKWTPEWTGVEYRGLVSVSKTAADPASMLSLVLKRP